MNKLFLDLLFVLGVTVPFISVGQSFYPGQFIDKLTIGLKIPIKAYSFDLSDIRVLDDPFNDDFFWNTVVDHHTFETGNNSNREKFLNQMLNLSI